MRPSVLSPLLYVLPAITLLSCIETEIRHTASDDNLDRFGQRPKLVVGITVDQMRHDYLYRYWDHFSDGGFKRLVGNGFVCSNHHFDYAPTYTGPGHASIYTGAPPSVHGIIANDWHVRGSGLVYCAGDTSQQGVGTESSGGKMSPHRLLTTTITDELRLSNNFKSKVIGISLKDRGSILPAGHHPNGAYWFIGKDEGNWVTSTWYRDQLPDWVNAFNAKKLPDAYLDQGWQLLQNEDHYSISYDDNNPFESPFRGQDRAVFPYDFSTIEMNRYEVIKSAPHGSSLSVDFAIDAITHEELGADEFTDFLALSFSSPDYAGHQFGPQSREIQDTYLRLDRDLQRLLEFLDARVGKGDYLVFLTSDHGGAPVPGYLNKFGMPGGYWRPQSMLDEIDERLSTRYGTGEYVESYSNDQLFFNRTTLAKKRINLDEIAQFTVDICASFPEVYTAVTTKQIKATGYTDLLMTITQNGVHPVRSGDLMVITLPGFIDHGLRGTTHGSGYNYDTHVPLIFYGKGIRPGELSRRTNITDIAPTVARLIRVSAPTGSTGTVIHEICDY